ncbi:MAG: hypothetical protein U1F49_13390 [Rubrivivax sp.]
MDLIVSTGTGPVAINCWQWRLRRLSCWRLEAAHKLAIQCSYELPHGLTIERCHLAA